MRKLPTVQITRKGVTKEYVMVKDRVAAFREDFPKGAILTDLLKDEDGVAVIKATILDSDGSILATGIAYEREGSTNINSTSYIENCETSAVGRALGFCGYGIDDSLGSANEVANAILQQEELGALATEAEKSRFIIMARRMGYEPTDVMKEIGWKNGPMTKAQHGAALLWLKEHGEA